MGHDSAESCRRAWSAVLATTGSIEHSYQYFGTAEPCARALVGVVRGNRPASRSDRHTAGPVRRTAEQHAQDVGRTRQAIAGDQRRATYAYSVMAKRCEWHMRFVAIARRFDGGSGSSVSSQWFVTLCKTVAGNGDGRDRAAARAVRRGAHCFWRNVPGDLYARVRPEKGGENRINLTLLSLCSLQPNRREFLQGAIVRRV